MSGRRRIAGVAATLVLLTACGGPDGPSAAELARQGGDATVAPAGRESFAQPVDGLSAEQRRAFFVGNSFFNDNWVTAPASAEGRDGLGPIFNAQSCSSCHFKDGRGRPPDDEEDPTRGLLLRLSVVDDDGEVVPHPTLGSQFQDRAVQGVTAEGRVRIERTELAGTYADGTPYVLVAPRYVLLAPDGTPIENVLVSPRVAPPVFGVGLLEAVPEAAVLALADPDDADGDGISGRPHLVPGPDGGAPRLGRFGWKAAVATVEAQNAAAFQADVGITSTLHPEQPCTTAQADCLAAPDGGRPELDDAKLARVTFYTRTLAVPARRAVTAPDVARGAELLRELGCTGCHVPSLPTGPADVPALAHQEIRPYTDLLLHDLGPALADDRPDGDATGREWRTAPLWGIGLTATVNGHTRFLHDGRARDLAEAVLWHGGEARAARNAFRRLAAEDRAALLAFLGSL